MSKLKRPLVRLLAAVLGTLCVLHARGRLDPPLAVSRSVELGLLARIAGPLREDRRGEKIVVDAGPYRLLARLPREPEGNSPLRPGMLVRLSGRLRPGRPARDPGDFDEARYLADRGLSGVVEARALALEPAPIPLSWRPWAAAEGARRVLQSRLRSALGAEDARLLEGLMLGYKGALEPDFNRALQDAGVMHLVVPSGAKVALVLGLCALPPLGLGWRCALGGALGGFFVLMVGAEPPYLRAYAAAVAYFGARLCGREADPFQALALSALAIVGLDARAPFSAGFQMTYAATAGVLLLLPRLSGRSRIASAILITGVVQAALWPVFANVFGKGSLAAPAANLVCCPLATALAGGGFLLPLLPILGPALSWGAGLFSRLVFFFASPAWASVPLSPMAPWAVAGYYTILFAALLAARPKVRLALGLAGALVWSGGAALSRAREPLLRVLYLSRTHNRPSAALVFFKGREPWLVGRASAGTLRRVFNAEGIGRVERVVDARTFRACAGAVCCAFAPPGVARRPGEFDILASRLRASAVEVTTDGSRIEVLPFSGTADQLGRPLL